jgi:stage V sporulation protein R
LIDRHAPYREKSPALEKEDDEKENIEVEMRHATAAKLRVERSYMDSFINPPDVLKAEVEKRKKELRQQSETFPKEPQRDVLLFLLENAELERWQQDLLEIVREEAYYFSPQGMTKVINEGWASYWHSTIMTTSGVMTDAEVIDYADHHSGTVAMNAQRINPYKIGLELFRDIEERWNKGRFGQEWEECDDARLRREWDEQTGLGRDKIFEVRRIYNDIGFIDTFFTQDFCNRNQLFTYHYNERTGRYEIETREFEAIKKKLLFSLTNFGQPYIYVIDANYENRRALLLEHRYQGIELKLDEARDTLQNLYKIWKRPVYIKTVIDDSPRLLSFNGKEHATRRIR